MANVHRGQVSLAVGDTTYTLSLSTNALCDLEDLFGKNVTEVAALLGADNVSMKTVRGMFWAALQDHHPDVDLKGAGRIITDAGMPAAMEAIGKAFKAAFPENSGSHPRKAAKA